MSLERLLQLQKENNEAEIDMIFEADRFKKIKNGDKTKAISSFNLFQTPYQIADKMSILAKGLVKEPCLNILEPSAGLGRLYNSINKYINYKNIILVENDKNCCEQLYKLTEQNEKSNLYQQDFLQFDSKVKFDLIIMNPPFKMGADIKHINKAYSLLSEKGVLISLCYNGVKQNKQLKPISDTWEVLTENSFKSEGTKASIALIVLKHQ